MTIASQVQIESHVKKLIKKNGRFSDDINLVFWNHTVLANVYEKGTNSELFLKIPTRATGKKECERAYSVKKIVGPHDHIIRIFDKYPLQFGEFYGVLMEKADRSLDDIISELGKSGRTMDLGTAKRITIHSLRGYATLHENGIIHRDGKTSNILQVGDIFKVSDFGTATDKEFTYSYESIEGYKSFEHIEQAGKKAGKFFTPQTDRFAVGIMLFQMLHPELKTPHTLWKHDQETDMDYADYVILLINNLKVDDDLKYILRRSIARAAPEKIPQGKYLEDFSYQSTNHFLQDLSKGPKITQTLPIDQNEDYKRFLRIKTELDNLLENADSHRTDNTYELMNHEEAARIIELYQEFLKQGKKKDVVSMPGKDDLATITTNLHEKVNEKEHSLFRTAIINNLSDEEKIMLFEKAFIWGPPITYGTDTEEGRKGRKLHGGKSRYTLTEIENGNTHFHKKLGAAPWYKKAT